LKLQLSFYVKEDGAGNRVQTGDLDVGNGKVFKKGNRSHLSETPIIIGLQQFSIILYLLWTCLGTFETSLV